MTITQEGKRARPVRFMVAISIVLTLVGTFGATKALSAAAGRATQQAQTQPPGQDWPTYLHDAARSSASGETILTTANVPYLQTKWAYATGGVVASEPAVVAGVVYAGSWDGYEYALNASTGALIWKTSLGITSDPACQPPSIGITSSATVTGGVVYVGGGDSYWYALNAGNGAVLWRVFTGLNTQAGAHYNWSSPLIVGNDAYIGVASNCDAPLVQGELLEVDLTSHQVVATTTFVPDGQLGGGVWTSPTYDAATNTVFVSTGTLNLYSQTLSQAVVALDATTLKITDHWQLPFEAAVSDSDWGTTPTLTVDGQGRRLLSLANKNGIVYTLQRGNLKAGPIWHRQIAIGGDCPVCGDGSIASGVFANGVLYYAGGGNVDAGGIGHAGSVTAMDPGTGQVLWYHGTNEVILGSMAYENGVIFDPQGHTMEALDAATGNAIWDFRLAAPMYAAPAVSNGIVYVGGLDGRVHAFGLPSPLPAAPPPDANCPQGFTCQDIGNPGIAGKEQVNADGSVTVTAAGKGARQTADQMRIITKPASGDFQVGVEDLSQVGGTYPGGLAPQIGIMIRESNAPGSPYYAALQDPTYPNEGETVANLIVFYRDTWNAQVVELTQDFPEAFPRWLIVQRHGDTFQTLSSADGVNYKLISGTIHTVVMPATLLAGMGVGSGGATTASTAVYRSFTLGAPTQTFVQQQENHPCPATWNCWDVGAGSPIGDETLVNGVWTVYGEGNGIAGGSDAFHYVYRTMTGNGTITARLTAQGNTSPQAQASVLMRADTSPGATYYGVVVNPNGTAAVQWRQYNGLKTRTTIPLPAQTLPAWFQIERYTDTAHTPNVTYYAALTSSDGTTWTQVAGSTIAIDLGTAPLVGLAGSSSDPYHQNPATWDKLTISNVAARPAGVCPAGFTCADIGVGSLPGNQDYSNGTWTFTANGSDIWDVYDQFHFVSQPMTADGTISARVVSVGPMNPVYDDQWEKAGVMLRATADPQSAYYGVFETPSHGIGVQWRTGQAQASNQILVASPNPVYPVYLMVGRWTDPHAGGATYYTAYTSTDNTNFTAVAGSTIALNMPGTILAGLAADSYAERATLPVKFDTLALLDNTEPAPPGSCPASLAGCADIGGALPSGTQTLNGTALTLVVGGGDIWGTADQFHFDWQSLAADGSVSARVATQQNTGVWAKAGVMMRGSTDPGSPYYAIFTTPGKGLAVQYRLAQGAATSQLLVAGKAPVYLRVTRYTDASGATYYTAFTSADGTTWNQVPNATVGIAMPGAVLAGWAADSYSQTISGTVGFDHIATATSSAAPAGLCPAYWTCTDVANATPAGSQNVTAGTWTVLGGGGDIWGTSDQFRYEATPMSGDGTMAAAVTSQSASDPWAKAGVMMRASNAPGAPYYAVLITPGHGAVVQWRALGGAASSQLAIAGAAPGYVKVSRWTDTSGATPVTYYSALTSTDGTTWTTVPRSAVAINLPATFLTGIAVTSHNTGVLSQVVLNAVTQGSTSNEPPDVCPGNFTCSDIGGATPAGTESFLSGAWSLSGGGGDIWGTADQFRYAWRSLPGDGTISARLTSLSNINAWTKAGLMIRAGNDPAAAYYAVLMTPANGLLVQYRTASGATTSQLAPMPAGKAPLFLSITRTGTTFSASTSSDGVTWTPLAGSNVSLPTLTGALLDGLAVCSHDPARLATALFDRVVIP